MRFWSGLPTARCGHSIGCSAIADRPLLWCISSLIQRFPNFSRISELIGHCHAIMNHKLPLTQKGSAFNGSISAGDRSYIAQGNQIVNNVHPPVPGSPKPCQMIPFPRNEDVVVRHDIFSELDRLAARVLGRSERRTLGPGWVRVSLLSSLSTRRES